jgi:hypothetical protein
MENMPDDEFCREPDDRVLIVSLSMAWPAARPETDLSALLDARPRES